MNEKQKKEILIKFKEFFKNTIAINHLSNLKKLGKLSKFANNPFLFKYLAIFLTGNTEPESLAKALIYPRILGTSINTSFGQNLQNAAPNIFKSVLGSTTSGIDVEFVDQIDGRKKYCQIKSGPNTINKDDVLTISNHFTGVRNLGRTNNVQIGIEDMIVGVLYGTPQQLSANYKKVMQQYPVYVGKDFWQRLTGDEDFYIDLIKVFGDVASETKSKKQLDEIISKLAEDIKLKLQEGNL